MDTSDRQDPEAEGEQQESEERGAGEPVQQEQTRVEEPEQQPPQPESDKAVGTEQKSNEAPLDPFEQSLLDILDEEWGNGCGFEVQGTFPQACHVLAGQRPKGQVEKGKLGIYCGILTKAPPN